MQTSLIPMSTAYAAWAGIGAVGTDLMDIVFFKELTGF